MLVKKYKCQRSSEGVTPCLNEFWGAPCGDQDIDELSCPYCGHKGTLVMFKGEYQVMLDTIFAQNRASNVHEIEEPLSLT